MLIQNLSKNGIKEKYEILAEFPFDSTRKRMTLIVRFGSKIILMCKGADSIILPRVTFRTAEEQEQKVQISKALLNFAREGLRTLVVAQKPLTKDQYNKFERNYQELKISTNFDKEKKLNDLYDLYEQDLIYAGSTAIEDKLQYGVPETIAKLIETNIKVWVLTGDKQETAIEIGKSCKLIQQDMSLEILTSSSEKEFRDRLLLLVKKLNLNMGIKVKNLDQVRAMQKGTPRLSIVIDGPTLVYAMKDDFTSTTFF